MKKKMSFLALLSITTAFIVGSFSCRSNFKESKALTDVDSQIQTVQLRSDGGTNHFIVIVDETISTAKTAEGTGAGTNYNALDYVNIYMDDHSAPVKLSDVSSPNGWMLNLWGSGGVMFPITTEDYVIYNGATIYAIEILQGCTYPNNYSQRCVNQQTKKFININYGDINYKNEAFSWGEEIQFEPSDETILLTGAQVRAEELGPFYICLTSNAFVTESQLEYADLSSINAYNKVKVYLSPTDEGKALGEVTSLRNGVQNKWASQNTFMFGLTASDYASYNGQSIYKITIEAGCQLVLSNKIVTISSNYSFINNGYGDAEKYYGSFDFAAELLPSEGTLDLFKVEVRGDKNGTERFIDLGSYSYFEHEQREFTSVDNIINAYDNIFIYLSPEDEGKTLGQITSLRKVTINLWESQSLMFALTDEEYETYNGTTIYRIKILSDCELIYNNTICKVSMGYDFINTDYGNANKKFEAFNFIPYAEPFEEKITLTGAQVRGVADAHQYYIVFTADIWSQSKVIEYANLSLINAYSHIKVYLNENDEGTLLSDVTSLRSGVQNKFGSFGFMFALTEEEYETYNGTTVYKLEVLDGCEFYFDGAVVTVDKGYRLINQNYGKESARYEAFNFGPEIGELKNFGTINIKNVHNRMGWVNKDKPAEPKEYNRWIMVLFDEWIYDVNLKIDDWVDRTNFLDNVLIYKDKDTEPYTLRSIYEKNASGVTIQQFGEKNMIGISISNEKQNDKYVYDGSHMHSIAFNAGIQIPTFENGEAGYRIINEKTLVVNNEYGMTGSIPNSIDPDTGISRVYEEWNLNWSVIRCLVTFTVVGIDNLEFPEMSLEAGQRVSLKDFAQPGYTLTATTSDGGKIYRYIIGTNRNINVILTYTQGHDSGEEEKEEKQPTDNSGGCLAGVAASSIIISSMATLGVTLILIKKRKINYEK